MQYNLKGTSLDLTAEVRGYIEKKLNRLDELVHDDAARTDVELAYLESEEKTYRAELMLHDGFVLRAVARGQTLHEAVDVAFGELYTELTRAKDKKRSLVRRGAVRAKEFIRGWRRNP
jgi:ribosomal subunit interface protein